jgi:hypothetical protein
MLFIPFKSRNDVTLNVPREICCNCGRSDGLSILTTRLTVIRYMVLGGTQLTIPLELPYCHGCSKSAKRKPVGIIKKLLVSAVSAFLFVIFFILHPDLRLPAAIRDNLFSVCALVALVSVFGVYSLQKPRAEQSSYYQPVRLRKLKQKFSGRITGYQLAFTNEVYAQRFIAANPEAIATGMLKIKTYR